MFLFAGTGRLDSRYVGEEDLVMMRAILAIGVAAAALGGCEVYAGADTELPGPGQARAYLLPEQQYPEQQQGGTYSPPSSHSFAVTYSGPNDAWQQATNYCAAHYGNSRVRLVSDDQTAGRAVFACDQI